MRRLILKMSISIDGFVSGPNGEADWIFSTSDDESEKWTVEAISKAGAHLLGSRIFKVMAAYWPTSTKPFAAPMNRIPKIVFSGSGEHVPTGETGAVGTWERPRVVTGDLAREVARLKEEPGDDLVAHGGAAFAQNLARLDLIDEYRLLTHPVALGRGLPLFSSVETPRALELVQVERFPKGVVAHVYRRKSPAESR